MFFTAIKMSDIDRLERIFARLSPTGWIFPEWLIYLKSEVAKNVQIEMDQTVDTVL